MKEPINFDKLENYILVTFHPPYSTYKVCNIEMVGLGARKFWIVPSDPQSNALQVVIYWQSNPMVEAIDTVEVELYKNGPGMYHGGKKRYNIKRNNILTFDLFVGWLKEIVKDFEPDLSTPI